MKRLIYGIEWIISRLLLLLFLVLFSIDADAQQRTISGVVTDGSGQPLPGVTVVVKGSTIGTVTNANGNYSLEISPQAEALIFSFVGIFFLVIRRPPRSTL